MDHHVLPVRTYLIVFGLLMVLMVATVGAAFIDFGNLALPIALAIATTKATLVVLYFMHIRFSGRLMAIFAASGFFFLFILVVFTFGDFLARDWSLSPSTYAVPFDDLAIDDPE